MIGLLAAGITKNKVDVVYVTRLSLANGITLYVKKEGGHTFSSYQDNA